jgi:hypothetical protein
LKPSSRTNPVSVSTQRSTGPRSPSTPPAPAPISPARHARGEVLDEPDARGVGDRAREPHLRVLDLHLDPTRLEPEQALDDALAHLARDLLVRTGEGAHDVGACEDPEQPVVLVDDRLPVHGALDDESRCLHDGPVGLDRDGRGAHRLPAVPGTSSGSRGSSAREQPPRHRP